VNGCFWHRHVGCPIATMPKSNTKFWADKFERNLRRDRAVRSKLWRMTWRVVTVWECEASSVLPAKRSAARLAGRLATEHVNENETPRVGI